jgi:hypothetical protein
MHSVFLHASGSRYGKKEADRREAEQKRARDAERQRGHEEFCAALRAQNPEFAKRVCGK